MSKEQAREFFEAAAKDEASLERRRGMEPAAAAGKDGEAADADLSAAAGGFGVSDDLPPAASLSDLVETATKEFEANLAEKTSIPQEMYPSASDGYAFAAGSRGSLG